MDPRREIRVRRRREARVEACAAQARARHATLLDQVEGLSCSLKLQGEPAQGDAFVWLCQAHVAHGFPLPKPIEARLQARLAAGVLVETILADGIAETAYLLLKVAAGGLKGRRRALAWSLLDYREYVAVEGWSPSQVGLVLELLGEARNGARARV